MKTAEEKARAFVIKNPHLVREGAVDSMVTMLTIYLKEQDRDTRHACAEAVRSCEQTETPNRVRRDEAIGACLTAKAV